MAYTTSTMISRPGYSGLGAVRAPGLVERPGYAGLSGFWDSIAAAGSNTVQAVEQIGAQGQAQKDLQAAYAAQSSSGITTLLLIGGVGVLAVMLLRRRKKAKASTSAPAAP